MDKDGVCVCKYVMHHAGINGQYDKIILYLALITLMKPRITTL
jgi:hypothetical protein